jgi:hypothetical protein
VKKHKKAITPALTPHTQPSALALGALAALGLMKIEAIYILGRYSFLVEETRPCVVISKRALSL